MGVASQTGAPDAAGALPVIAVCGLAFEAAIAAGPGVLTSCGPGAARLAHLVEEMPAPGAIRCAGIISFGCAGGLDPALRPGTCVIAEAIVSPGGRFPVDSGWLQALCACLPGAVRGTLAGSDQPVPSAAAKAWLWQTSGACAVDMESHRAALIAQQHGLPFVACRVVVDPAQRSLPRCATAGLRDDGQHALMPMLRALASSPGQLPALIQLASDARASRRSLRAVRSQLGTAFAIPAAAPGFPH